MLEVLKSVMAFTSAAAIACAFLTGCHDKNMPAHSSADDSTAVVDQEKSKKDVEERSGSFVITLYPEYAPETCDNFVDLVQEGFYDGLTFHRVVDDFMAQGGAPKGDGTGGSDKTIKGEFSENGFTQNTLSHKRGIVSMARSGDPDSASSQFFICYSDDCTFLDGKYAAFGEVTEGMDFVDSFLEVERTYNGTDKTPAVPTVPITITKAQLIEDDKDGHPQAQFDITIG